jgi:hypothetical protein
MEANGILTGPQLKIELCLKESKAFSAKKAVDLQAADLALTPALDIMEKSGLIARTPEGKVYMTSKGQERSIRGFKVDNDFPDRKFVRFSRNK